MALTRDRLTVLSKRIVAVFEDVYLKAISILAEIWQIDPWRRSRGPGYR